MRLYVEALAVPGPVVLNDNFNPTRNPMTQGVHTPVLLQEVLDHLRVTGAGCYLDCTFGAGGYTAAILRAGADQVYAVDRDPEAIERGQALVDQFPRQLHLIEGTFGNIENYFAGEEQKFDGIVFDLGVSSPQIDQAERGFSFRKDGPLDMRMSQHGQSAADLVNTASEDTLKQIIRDYGEEKFAGRVARVIVEQRKIKPFETTLELAEAVRSIVHQSRDGIDPATRTFQGIRIAVNDELGEIERALKGAVNLLKPGGRLVVVSFHSLEDRLVKSFFKDLTKAKAVNRYVPYDIHEEQKALPFVEVTRKIVVPSEEECRLNPRARSSKLRAYEKKGGSQ